MNLEQKKKFLVGKLDFAEHLHGLLQVCGRQLPTAEGKESNKSQRLQKLIGRDKKLALGKDNPQVQELLFCGDEEIENLLAARIACFSWPKHLKRIAELERQANTVGGTLRIPTRANGCHTHRCAGTEKVNFYNFPKHGSDLTTQIAHCCTCPDQFRLLIFDYAQVECRRANHLAGQDDVVQTFVEGRDIYCEFATDFYQEKVRKPTDEDDPVTYKKLEGRRHFGKQNILGNQYGKGVDRTWEGCKTDPILNQMIKDGTMTYAMVKKAIDLYRQKNYAVVAFWKKLEQSFQWVFKHKKDRVDLPNGISFWYEKDWDQLVIGLPGGACLYYQEPRMTQRGGIAYRYTSSEKRTLWGGFLLENVCQADCGVLLREKVVAVEQQLHLPVLLDIYDSIFILVPKKSATREFDRVEKLLLDVPDWMSGCPLAVEGKIATHIC